MRCKSFYILLIFSAFFSHVVTASGLIETVAGTGLRGVAVDQVVATLSPLNSPRDVVVDALGNLYIADSGNHQVHKIDTAGVISIIAGIGVAGFSGDGGLATAAQLNTPYDLALDLNGNLYIADALNHRIRKVSSAGVISTVAGTGIAGFSVDLISATGSKLNLPTGIALDSLGNLYIADSKNHRLRKVDSSGIISTLAGNGVSNFTGDLGLAVNAKLNLPSDVALDGQNNLYILDRWYGYVRKIDAVSGIITTIAGNIANGAVQCAPQPCYNGDNIPALQADLSEPFGLSVDLWGNVYIADTENHRVRRVNQQGLISTVAGTGALYFSGDGVPAETTSVYRPFAVTVDRQGVLYIADKDNHRIRRAALDLVAPSGSIATPSITNSLTVTLTTTCSDDLSGCREMRLSNDGQNWAAWQSYSASIDWILPAGDGLKTVFAQFRDALAQASVVVNTSLLLDTTAPVTPQIVTPVHPTYSATANHILSGQAEAGSTVELFANGVSIALVSTDAAGRWQISHLFAEGIYSIRATAMDAAGNVGSTAVAVTLLIDRTAPQITPPVNHILEATGMDSALTLIPPTVLDSSPVTLSHNGPSRYPLGITSITWTAVDFVGNQATALETVTIVDSQAPVLSLNGNANLTLKISVPYQELGATAVDLVDGDVSASVQVSGSVDTFTLGRYTLRYDAQDSRGNASFVLRTVQVVALNAPVIQLKGADVILEAGDPYQDAGATAVDDLGNDLSADIIVSSSVNSRIPGIYSVLYQVSDPFGNSTQLGRLVTVLDRNPASLSLLGSAHVILEAGELYQEVGVVAQDLVDGDLAAAVQISGRVNNTLPATYLLNYSVRDAAGNLSNTLQRTVVVVDSTPPLLSIPADLSVVTDTLLTAVDFGQASANDLFPVTLSHDAPSRFPLGETVVTWVARDFYGNQSQAQQRVTVQDRTAPSLLLLGDRSTSLLQGELYQEPGFEALDQVEGDLTALVQVRGEVNSAVPGIYSLSYDVRDSSGNAAPELIRTVRVISILDADGDGILDEFDLDDDNDGLPDLLEGTADSDGDGVPNYLDLDSDNDGLPDLLEAMGVDEGNDGLWDQFVDLNGDGLSDDLLLMPLLIMDTDGDGLPDYLDLDSDGDTLMDIIEAGGMDYNNDGQVDLFIDQNGDGWSDQFSVQPLPMLDSNQDGVVDQLDKDLKFALTTSVTGVGSNGWFWLLSLVSLLIVRRNKLVLLPFLPMLAFSPVNYSRAATAVDANFEPLPNPTWSINALTGISRLQPSRTQFGVDIADNQATALGLAVGFQWHKEWLLEGFALDLGEVRLKHRLAQIGELGSLAYKAYGLSLEYLMQMPNKKLQPYLKGGLHMLQTEATDSRVALRNLNDIGIHWGAGFLWPINSHWGVKLDYSQFDRDAQVLALVFQARWGRSSSVVKTASLPPAVVVQKQVAEQASLPLLDEAKAELTPVDLPLIQARIGFAYDQSVVSEAEQLVLQDRVLPLLEGNEVVLLLAGHTDSRGILSYNQSLSLERANAVRDYLIQQGMNSSRLSVKGYGESQPLDSNATVAGRAKNRRVEIRIVQP